MIKKIYKTLKETIFYVRILTVKFRMAPKFIIIGTQKGGTTSLFYYLSQHPQLLLPKKKEIHYYTKHYKNGLNWYLAHFPFKKNKVITGESTPYYLFHPEVPERLLNDFPKIKLIVMLRNPVDRAYSHYHMEKKLGNEEKSFENAIDFELENLNGLLNGIEMTKKDYTHRHAHSSYLSRGFYKEQIERWLCHFDRNQLLFVKSECFYKDPQNVLDNIFTFLNVDNFEVKDFDVKWKGSYSPLEKEYYVKLSKIFSIKNKELSVLIGNKFKWN